MVFLSTPSARRATLWARPVRGRNLFLSTPSARRATVQLVLDFTILWISIHALREEGDLRRQAGPAEPRISIHALREEGDAPAMWYRFSLTNFYPRPPRGGRPLRQSLDTDAMKISIHALREEGDTLPASTLASMS